MKIEKSILIVFLFILLSVSCFSFSTYQYFGNSEQKLSGCSYWSFSSCYPQNDLSLNFSKSILSQTMSVEPIIWYHQNSASYSAQERFIYAFSGTSMYAYYLNNFQLYNTNTLKGIILFQPSFIRSDAVFSGYLIVIPYTDGSQKKINVCDADVNGNICKNTDFSFNISNTAIEYKYESIYGNTAVLLSNGTIETYNFLGTKTNSFYTRVSSITPIKTPPNSDKLLSIGDYDSDGSIEVVYAIPYTYQTATYQGHINITYGMFDIDSASFDLSSKEIEVLNQNMIFGNPALTNFRLNMVTFGSQTAQPRLSFYISYNAYVDGSGNYLHKRNYLYSQNGVSIWNDVVVPNNQAFTELHSNAVYSDINYDSYNEVCGIRKTGTTGYYQLMCQDTAGTYLIASNITQQPYMSMGKYTNNSYESVMLRTGLYNFDGVNMINIFNFTASSGDDIPYPVSLRDKLNYSNDIFIVSTNQIIAYRLSSPSSICGDGVCSASETPVMCEADCFIPPEAVITLLATNEPCTDNSECLSGLCSQKKCILKGTNEACALDSECLSGECINNVCSDAGLYASVNQIKNQYAGESDFDGLIIFIIFIVICFVAGIWTGYATGSIIPFVACCVVGVCTFVAFAIFGWLPAWFILVTIIMLIALTILGFWLFGNKGG